VRKACIAGFGLVCVAGLSQQSFEVASIKLSAEATPGSSGIFESPGRISAQNVTLKRCLRGAYNMPESQIAGGPKWVGEDRYFIEAKAATPAGDHDLMLMLRTLLAERFKLVVHREQRTIAGYKLVAGKNGLKAKVSTSGRSSGNARRGRIDAEGYTMGQFALKLSEALHLTVADMTGISGKYDFKLEWTPDDMQAKAPSDDQRLVSTSDNGPSIFAALQEQLGLKLESSKVPAEVLVIDSVERPSAN